MKPEPITSPPVELWRVVMLKVTYPKTSRVGQHEYKATTLGEVLVTAQGIEGAEEEGRLAYPEATACRGYCKDSAGLWHWVFASSF